MSSEKGILEEISQNLIKGNADSVKELTEKAIGQDIPAVEILNDGLVNGMNVVGEKFKNNEFFIPEVLISARDMKAGMNLIKPLLAKAKVKARGRVIMGTVRGDLHDIGKNIVAMMLEGAGFDVINMGTDVTVEKIMTEMDKDSVDVIGLSALLTTTMVYMKDVVDSLKEAGMKDRVKVIIG